MTWHRWATMWAWIGAGGSVVSAGLALFSFSQIGSRLVLALLIESYMAALGAFSFTSLERRSKSATERPRVRSILPPAIATVVVGGVLLVLGDVVESGTVGPAQMATVLLSAVAGAFVGIAWRRWLAGTDDQAAVRRFLHPLDPLSTSKRRYP